jgi:DNA-binding IclR family transcriptional regulator
MDIIDLLAEFPTKGFSLTEIMQATDINVSSCHTVLMAMVERGYLIRCPKSKNYFLGPMLVATGESALTSHPLVEKAKSAAENLSVELDVPVQLYTLAGGYVVSIFSIADTHGHMSAMRVRQRVPLIPPLGAPFFAWAPEKAIADWLSRRPPGADQAIVEGWRRALAVVRERGYQVTLRVEGRTRNLASLLGEMAFGSAEEGQRAENDDFLQSMKEALQQPETIDPEARYEVNQIASPIFDDTGHALYNLCLGSFSRRIAGTQLQHCAERLMQVCLDVMRENRKRAK